MENEPLAFGGEPEQLGAPNGPELRLPRPPRLEAAARKVLGILEPLDARARARVLRAAAILLELDEPEPWIR